MPGDVWALPDGYLSWKLSLTCRNKGEENVLIMFQIPARDLFDDGLLLSTSQLSQTVEESASRSVEDKSS